MDTVYTGRHRTHRPATHSSPPAGDARLSAEGVPRGLIQPRGAFPRGGFERGRGALSGFAEGGLLRSHREHCRAHSLS